MEKYQPRYPRILVNVLRSINKYKIYILTHTQKQAHNITARLPNIKGKVMFLKREIRDQRGEQTSHIQEKTILIRIDFSPEKKKDNIGITFKY